MKKLLLALLLIFPATAFATDWIDEKKIIGFYEKGRKSIGFYCGENKRIGVWIKITEEEMNNFNLDFGFHSFVISYDKKSEEEIGRINPVVTGKNNKKNLILFFEKEESNKIIEFIEHTEKVHGLENVVLRLWLDNKFNQYMYKDYSFDKFVPKLYSITKDGFRCKQ